MEPLQSATRGPAPGFVKHPGHEVRLEHDRRVAVRFGGRVIAESDRAIALRESDYPVRYYIPRGDVADDVLTATEHESYCPFKGRARYWTVAVDGKSAENAAWAYDEPYDECAALAGHIAFYDEKMDGVDA